MPKFQSNWERLVEYVTATYPGTAIGVNAMGLVSNLSNEDQTEGQFTAMMEDLGTRFPGAFAIPAAVPGPVADSVSSPSTKACSECGESILAVARKCKHCLSPVADAAVSGL